MSADERKLTQLRVAFTRHGITKRPDVLRLAAEAVGRHLYSTRAMTGDEVDALIARLARVPVGALPSHAARLEREEEARAAAAASAARPRTTAPAPAPPTATPAADPFAPAIAVLRAHGLLAEDNGANVPDGDNGGVLPLSV